MSWHRRSHVLLLVLSISTIGACSSSPSAAPLDTGAAITGPLATRATESPIAPSAPIPSPVGERGLRLAAITLALGLPVAVSRAVAFTDGQSILLAGGLSSKGTLRSVLAVDPSNRRREQVGQLAIDVHDAAGAIAGNRLLVFGGGNLAPVRTVQQLIGANSTVVGELPKARADLAAVTFDGVVIVIGGGTPAQLDREILSTADGVTFRSIGTLRFGARYPAVAVVSHRVLVVGGTDGSQDLSTIQAFDPATGIVRVIGRLPHVLSHASAFTLGSRLFVAGGRTAGKAQDTIWEIDPTSGAASVAGRLPLAVSDGAVVVLDGVAYLLGGETDTFQASIIAIRLV
jgi:Kelch motif